MPLYEYVCADCGAGFEKLVHRFGEEVDCPSCSSAQVDRQLSVFAVASSSPSPVEVCGAQACGDPRGGGAGPCGGGACRRPG